MDAWKVALGELIRAKRKEAHLTQEALAKLVGLKRKDMILRYEAGTDAPSVDLFGRIALALGITEISINGSRFLVRRPSDEGTQPAEQLTLEFGKEHIYVDAAIKITPIRISPTEVTITIVAIAPVSSP